MMKIPDVFSFIRGKGGIFGVRSIPRSVKASFWPYAQGTFPVGMRGSFASAGDQTQVAHMQHEFATLSTVSLAPKRGIFTL